MADDKTKVGKGDRDRINTSEDYELNDWSKHFGVSKDQIKQAVNKVGPMVRDVERELKKK